MSRMVLVALVGVVFLAGCIREKSVERLVEEKIYTIGDYNLKFVDSIVCEQEVNIGKLCDGKIFKNNTIEIDSRLSLKRILEVCNHEICHNELNLPYIEEEPICVGKENKNYPECLELIELVK